MIIWSNGLSGVGKSTTAMALGEHLSKPVGDPEPIGFSLPDWAGTVAPLQPSRKYPHGGRLTRDTAAETGKLFGVAVVHLTPLNEKCIEEIIGELRAEGEQIKHFTLTAALGGRAHNQRHRVR